MNEQPAQPQQHTDTLFVVPWCAAQQPQHEPTTDHGYHKQPGNIRAKTFVKDTQHPCLTAKTNTSWATTMATHTTTGWWRHGCCLRRRMTSRLRGRLGCGCRRLTHLRYPTTWRFARATATTQQAPKAIVAKDQAPDVIIIGTAHPRAMSRWSKPHKHAPPKGRDSRYHASHAKMPEACHELWPGAH